MKDDVTPRERESYKDSNSGGNIWNNPITRRRFLKRTGGATVASVFFMSQRDVCAEISGGTSGSAGCPTRAWTGTKLVTVSLTPTEVGTLATPIATQIANSIKATAETATNGLLDIYNGLVPDDWEVDPSFEGEALMGEIIGELIDQIRNALLNLSSYPAALYGGATESNCKLSGPWLTPMGNVLSVTIGPIGITVNLVVQGGLTYTPQNTGCNNTTTQGSVEGTVAISVKVELGSFSGTSIVGPTVQNIPIGVPHVRTNAQNSGSGGGGGGGGSQTTEPYQVQSGDTLFSIAAAHGITLAELLALNPNIGDPNKIKFGDEIQVPSN